MLKSSSRDATSCFVRKHMLDEHRGMEVSLRARVTHSNTDSLIEGS